MRRYSSSMMVLAAVVALCTVAAVHAGTCGGDLSDAGEAMGQAAGALGMDQAQVLDFARSVGLPDFDIGTDRVLKDMPANIHQGEIIIEPARSDRIRAEIESRVSGSGSQQLVSAVTELMQVVQSSRQDLRLTIVAADGKVLTEQVLEDVWSRSQRGERVLHVDGLVGSAA